MLHSRETQHRCWHQRRRRGSVQRRVPTPLSPLPVDLIDNSLLSELGDILGPRLNAVIETCVGHLAMYLGEIEQAVAGGGLTAVHAVAHQLKGGARAIGTVRLGDAAAVLECAAADGDADAVRTLAAPIPALAQEPVAALRAR